MPIPPSTMQIKLLTNALDFIASAGAHTKTVPDTRLEETRALKYAVLHLTAGVELLLKERLRLEHWSLIFDRPDEATVEKLRTGDFRSVGWNSLIQRLEGVVGLGLDQNTQSLLEALRKERHRLEHFEFRGNVETVRSLVYAVSSFTLDFVHAHLSDFLDPVDMRLLDEIKQVMFENDEFIQARMTGLGSRLDKVGNGDSAIISCPGCMQETFVFNQEECHCLFCHWVVEPSLAAEEWATLSIRGDPKEIMDVYKVCPECEDETFIHIAVFEENERGRTPDWLCFSCGYNARYNEIHECVKCGQPLSEGQGIGAVCRKCFQYVVSKDD